MYRSPEGAFGWGNPDFGQPKISILSRRPDPSVSPGEHLADVEVEMGVSKNLRVRFSLPVHASASAAAVRKLAWMEASNAWGDANEHSEMLNSIIAEFGERGAFSGPMMVMRAIGEA